MRRAISLSLLLIPATSFAVLGDWKIWSPVNSARMTVFRSPQTVLAATTGGVVSWDPTTSIGKVMTGIDGLPTLDMAGIVSDSSGNIWAVGVDGRLAVLEAGASFWTSLGSYATTGWQFSPGAVIFWNGYLVLGGPKGLSLFSTKNRVAADYASTFGTLADTVTGVFASGDSLWVSTPSGLAIASDPVWATDSADKHIGTAGYFLNSLKWSFRNPPLPVNNPRLSYRIRRDSTGVHQVLTEQWSNYNPSLQGLKLEYGQFTAPDQKATVMGAQDAVSTTWGYFLSTSSDGLVQLDKNGAILKLPIQGALPDRLPFAVAMAKDGTPTQLATDGASTRVWRRTPSGSWQSDTIRNRLPSSPNTWITPTWAFVYDIAISRKVMTFGPGGELVVGSWEDPRSGGGLLVSDAAGSWTQWNHDNDTCIPLNSPAGVSVRSVSPGRTGVWASSYVNSAQQPLVFLPSSGNRTPQCLSFDPVPFTGPDKPFFVNDFLEGSDALWLATSAGLLKVPHPAPSTAPTATTGILQWSSAPLNRLTFNVLGGSTWIVAAGSGFLGALPANASNTDALVSVNNITQAYLGLVTDALGNVWAAGDKGLDIWGMTLSDSSSLKFDKIRSIHFADGLPDELIYDIALDSASGKALIATRSGLALWTSPYHSVPARLAKSSIRVWPNPIRLRQHKALYGAGAPLGAEFNLMAADGTLVLHKDRSQSLSGTFQIDLPSISHLRPGIYYWSLKDANGTVHGPLLVGE